MSIISQLASMQFAPLSHADLDEVRNLQPEDWSDIMPEIEYYVHADLCYPIKATLDDRIVGTGTYLVFENTAWLAHIIVDGAFRKRGIGLQIVLELLRRLQDFPVETCLLTATMAGKSVYEKAGFRTVGAYIFFKREFPWKGGPVSPKLAPFREAYRSSIYELDEKASGENRRKLIPEFLETSVVYLDNDRVLGYYLPDLRNGPIVADSIDAGLALMQYKYADVDKAVLPAENTAGLEFLKQHGFVESGLTSPRMVFGKNIAWKPEMVFSRIGGNFG